MKLINLLTELGERNISPEEKSILEDELESSFANLNLNEVSGKDFKKKLTRLVEFLNKNLFLIVEGQYTGLGSAFGILAGFIVFNLSSMFLEVNPYMQFCIPVIFMMVGLLIGSVMESQASKLGRVLKTKI